MNLEQLLEKASEYELDYGVVVDFASSQKLSLVDFVNSFALALAKGYQDKRYDFEFSDGAANWLFGFMTDEVFLNSNNNTLPSPAYDVYLAFDEGEYHHKGDAEDVVAEEKYTKPRINEILSGGNS
ncbi:hypothetical protein ORJ00_16970 [Rheinheimera baltica]|uniref:hypothetical protein n=1 Tax=Rheinheimera baltica TaxID=67576 RepID=UPI00274004ED|nr:hypothetical protein [Rheinheimera baltica]MDP5144444.1 hypothetical protein [Rheinheimera baltica]